MNREIMKQAGFAEELEAIDSGKCPTCKREVGKFRDALSKKEFGISGMCQKCQDSIFGRDGSGPPPETQPFEADADHVGLDGDVFVVDKPYRMFSGAAEAARFVYRKVVDAKGKVWLYPVNSESPAEQVHFHDPLDKRSQGYGGSTLHFELEDGTTYAAAGPWHSAASSMFDATGIDIRNTHWTYGCVAKHREYKGHVAHFKGVLHADEKPVLGSFDRLKLIAQAHADRLKVPVACYSESKGGSSSGWEIPTGTEWRGWSEWFKAN